MIDYKVKKGRIEVNATGDPAELVADTLTLISAMYTKLFDVNTIAATFYRDSIERELHTAFEIFQDAEEDE